MPDALQKQTAEAIINIFETGRILGNYATVTLIAGDRGHLTYGRSQTTLASGNLFLLIKAYCEAPNALFGAALAPYLGRLSQRDVSLDQDPALRSLLRQAGDDTVMQEEQDAFFDRVYWAPAQREALRLGINTGLGSTVVYDGFIHGSFARMRDATTQVTSAPSAATEKAWIGAYVKTRRAWLASCKPPLPRTVYRMDAFNGLIQSGNWELALPIRILGRDITEDSLQRAVRSSAQDTSLRLLGLQNPHLEGSDVLALQVALNGAGFPVEEDSDFGPETKSAVEAFQAREGLRVDGIAGPATRAALGLT